MDTFNKNEKQHNFNMIKGKISEFNDDKKYCSITLTVGHERPRFINFSVKKETFDNYLLSYGIGDKVAIQYFASSNKKETRWYTTLSILHIEKVLEKVEG